MNPIKSIIWNLGWLHRTVDPLLGQRRYAQRTLRDKRNTIVFTLCNSSMSLKIKELWGRSNAWFDFYNTVGDSSKTHLYFPDDWFYDYVDAKMNKWRLSPIIDDKSLYDFYFYDVTRPKTLATCQDGQWLNDNYYITGIDDIADICKTVGKFIVKPSFGSSGGKGISFWQEGDGSVKDLISQYNNCVVQSIIEQHADLAVLHPKSINSIRIMTLLLDGEVKILSSVLRLGVGNSKVDNVSSGGVACGIDEKGYLREMSFNAKGQSWNGHPDGLKLKGRKVPSYDECCEISKRIAPRFVRFSRLISWDFAVDKNGKPLLIEANLYGGELDFHQMCNGPIFGDEKMTKEMIARFFIKNKSQKWKELLT